MLPQFPEWTHTSPCRKVVAALSYIISCPALLVLRFGKGTWTKAVWKALPWNSLNGQEVQLGLKDSEYRQPSNLSASKADEECVSNR